MQGGGYGDFRVDGYEIEGLLGAGPTGELWLARHTASHSHVGLKRLHPKDVDAHDEARRIHAVLGMLNHPSLLRVRELLSYGNDELVLVLDRSDGGTLDQLLMARPMLDPGETVMIGATIAHALAAIHEHGLVHGDITPESIVFTTDGQPLLTDVGLSGLVERWDVLGTHGYTDPAASGSPEPSGDIYGVAAVCYTALSGAPLDPEQQRRPLHQVNPGVPAALSHAIEAGLQSQAASRPDASAFAAQLDAAAPRSAVRFPDGGGGFTSFADSPGERGSDPFVLDANQASSAPNAPGGPTPSTNPLFALDSNSGPSFTPGAPTPADQSQQSTHSGYQAATPGPYASGAVAAQGVQEPTVDEDDDEDEGGLGRGFRLPMKALLIGIPSVLAIALIIMVVSWILPSGGQPGGDPNTKSSSSGQNGDKGGGGGDIPSEPNRPEPELTGENAQKWANVWNELDDQRASAFETLDKKALEQIYAPDSGLAEGDRQYMDTISQSGFEGIKGLWTMLRSIEVVSENKDNVELTVRIKLVETMYAVSEGNDVIPRNKSTQTEQRRMTLVSDGDGGWLISEDYKLNGQAN